MTKLFEQLMKFGIVGVLALVIDWGIMNLLMIFVHASSVIAGTISFLISLMFNYTASMKFVFKHRQDMSRWMEIVIFFVSAAIGLLINILILWISTLGMIPGVGRYVLFANLGKLISTVVVSIWNFVIRKWLLDDTHTNAVNRLKNPGNRLKPEELETKWQRSFSHRLGMWSIEHSPKGWR